MTITYDLDLNSFNAWSGAVDTLDRIQREGKCEEESLMASLETGIKPIIGIQLLLKTAIIR